MKKIFERFREKISYETRYWEEPVLKDKFDDVDIEVLKNLYESLGKVNWKYEPEEMEGLKEYKLPEEVIEFYKKVPLEGSVDIGGDINFATIEGVVQENTQFTPGALLVKYGVITIATTTGGNAICLDMNRMTKGEPRVIIVDHSMFCGKTITIREADERLVVEIDYNIIEKYAPEISNTFTGFLDMIVGGEIDDVEDYL